MASQFHSLFTTQGLALLREAIQNGTKIGITHMAYGDGNGIVPTPNADFTKLVREVYRTPLNRLSPSKENSNWLEADGVIPSAVGGFNIREVGLYAGNVLVAYANYPATYKPSSDQGTAQIKTIRIVLQIDNTANFELKIDASVVMATIQSVEEAKTAANKYSDETKVQKVQSLNEMLTLEGWDGRTVFAEGLQGGFFTYDSSLKSSNDKISIFNGWKRKIEQIVTPFMAGATLGNDDSESLNIALKFARENNLVCHGVNRTYKCHSVLIDSNQKFYSANLECNKFDTDLISVLETSTDSSVWLESVELIDIHIDGKRILHTNVKTTTLSEDGGRHGFRFVRKCRNIVMKNCSANFCASDGIMIFPSTYNGQFVTAVENFVIEDCTFNWNRRHGGSNDRTVGLRLKNTKCNFNGRYLEGYQDAPATSGAQGDKPFGVNKYYGSGWDVEEYSDNQVSRNLTFENCQMINNAKGGLLILATAGAVTPSFPSNIVITGGEYDTGVLNNSEGWAISITANSLTNSNYVFENTNIDNVNCHGDIILRNNLNYSVTRTPTRVVATEKTVGYVDSNITSLSKQSQSISYTEFVTPYGKMKYDVLENYLEMNALDKTIYHMEEPTGDIHVFEYRFGDISRGAFAQEIDGSGSINWSFRYGANNTESLKIKYNGSILPNSDKTSSLGARQKRFKDLHAADISIQPSIGFEPQELGEVTFQKVSDTKLILKFKGSDGVVRGHELVFA
ncbi:Phage tail-collar fiber family protein [Acinetobacter baumannii]|nr:phage tail protein [Acinetobacter baumannii]QEY03399.1 Phage tail-collar fiber family protein [Acinetobacter baumannii]